MVQQANCDMVLTFSKNPQPLEPNWSMLIAHSTYPKHAPLLEVVASLWVSMTYLSVPTKAQSVLGTT